MRWLRWLLAGLALIEGGWLAFDGGRALVTGDYVTPSTGPYAGQLGPWAKVVQAAGLDPRSTLVKSVHLVLGAAMLASLGAFLAGARWGPRTLRACALAGLWYLPFGTLLGIAQVVVLSRLRRV